MLRPLLTGTVGVASAVSAVRCANLATAQPANLCSHCVLGGRGALGPSEEALATESGNGL